MDIFEQVNFECKLDIQKIDHAFQTVLDSFFIESTEIELCPTIEESVKELMIQEAEEGLGQRVSSMIQSMIDAIKNFASKSRDAVVNTFTSKEAKEKMNKVKEVADTDSKTANTKVEVEEDDIHIKLLDEYIREMAKLERQLMNLKVQSLNDKKGKKDSLLNANISEILNEMNKLNDRFDKSITEDKIVPMALKDAIRFNEKQLDNIKVDYDAVAKESEKVLAEFKKDAKGCDVPVKYNALQKMVSALGTRIRRILKKRTDCRRKNLKAIIAVAIGSAIALGAAKGVGKNLGNRAANAVIDNMDSDLKDSLKTKGRDLAAKAGILGVVDAGQQQIKNAMNGRVGYSDGGGI